MAQMFANAARSTLQASVTSTAIQLLINPADQGLFPVATGADWFKVALQDASGNIEYIKVQRAVGQSILDVPTGGRAIEDSAKFPARAFNAGSLIELRMTAADLASSIAHPGQSVGAHAATAISNTPAGNVAATNVQAAVNELDAAITVLDTEKQSATGTFPYAQITGAPSRYSTGEYVFTDTLDAPAGTLFCDGSTIGDALSGAAFASPLAQALFASIWNTHNNTVRPILDSSGSATTRGASAAADWAAHKRLPIPTFRDGDAAVAARTSVLSTPSNGAVAAHTHPVTDPGHIHAMNLVNNSPAGGGSGAPGFTGPEATGLAVTGITVNTNAGSAQNWAAGVNVKVWIAL